MVGKELRTLKLAKFMDLIKHLCMYGKCKEHVRDAYYQHKFVYPYLILQISTILGHHPHLHIVTMHPKTMNMYMNQKPTTKAQVIF
jgi:uncharacterized protein VirK/YbjX